MPLLLMDLFGLLPAVAVVGWEAARQRRRTVTGFARPVSAEGVRWAQYTAGVYLCGYAGLAIAWADRRAGGPALLLPHLALIACTCLSGLVMLLWLGQRHGSVTPRLDEMRADLYRCRLLVRARTIQLGRLAWRPATGPNPALQATAARGHALAEACTAQLRRVQQALSTRAFAARLHNPAAGAAAVRALRAEQLRLFEQAERYLQETALLTTGALADAA